MPFIDCAASALVAKEGRGGLVVGAPLEEVDRALSEVMVLVSEGCHHSFERLYRLTSQHMHRIVVRIVGEPAAAEEVLQEAFLSVWTKAARFDARKGRTVTWLASVCRNAAIDHLRRRDARPKLQSPPAWDEERDPYADLHSSMPEPVDLLMAAQASRAVRDCLQTLSDDSRECLTLAFYGGLTHAEMASRLGEPLGSVKSRIRRSMQSMRPVLADHRHGCEHLS